MIRVAPLLFWLLAGVGTVWAQTGPVLRNLEANNLVYNEGDPTISITSTLQVASQVPISRAIVQLTDGYVAEQDQLIFSDTEGLRGIYDAPSGTLLLVSYPAGSSGSAVSFQNALRTVTYQNTNLTNPQPGLRGLSIQAFDEQGRASAALTRNLSVLATDNPPELSLPNDAPIAYANPGNGQPVAIFDGLNVVDPDGNTISSAEVTIDEGFRLDEDRLLLTDNSNDDITVTVSSNGQTVTLNGADTPEAYQNALRSIQFSNSTLLVAPTEGNRKITVTVSDQNARSLGVSRFVTVGNADVPPTVSTVTKATTTGADLPFTRGDFASQYRDPESAPFTGIFIRSRPRRGTLLFKGREVNNSSINRGLLVGANEFSELLYRSDSDFTGEDQFLWNASDGSNFAANNATVSIQVSAPEPTIELTVPDAVTVPEEQELRLPPLTLTVNPEVSVTATLSVSNGVLSLPEEVDTLSLLSYASGDGMADPTLVFTGSPAAIAYALSGLLYLPNEGYEGPDALSVSVSASSNATDTGTLTITVVPNNELFRLSNLESGPLTYPANAPPVELTDQLTVEVLDDESTVRIASATVTISEGYTAEEDILGFISSGAITGDQQDNVLTLSGVADASAYQEALRAVTYQNTSDEPVSSKAVTFTLFDETNFASNTVTRSITVQPTGSLTISLPRNMVTVCSDQTDTLVVALTSNQTDVTYEWTCDSGDCGFMGATDQPTVVIAPPRTTQYFVVVSSAGDELQVRDTVDVTVSDCPGTALDIPSGFTPNDDGENDQWVINNAPPPLAVEIFDRYGHSVYQSDDYQNDWRGTYDGTLLPVGTYYYVVTDLDGETYKGAISILR